jgi:hypothetical protein
LVPVSEAPASEAAKGAGFTEEEAFFFKGNARTVCRNVEM